MEPLVKITAVGDLFPGNRQYHRQIGIAGAFEKHTGVPWRESINNIFSGSDIGLANLESPLLEQRFEPGKQSYAGSRSFAGFLKDTGINMVSVANNHILEYGEDGFENTISVLKDYKIDIVGIYDDYGSNIIKIEKNGLTIAFAAFNAIDNSSNKNKYANYSLENVLTTIQRMGESDFKVLVMHWGDEYVNIPSPKQISVAKKFIDAGATVIIGHHPHVIQPIIEYNGGLIMYSLGNFLFDMTYRKNVRIGMVANIQLTKNCFPACTVEGIYISDDFTPVPYDNILFNKLTDKNNEALESMERMTPEKCKKTYDSLTKRKRMVQRIYMKYDLIDSLKKLPFDEKKRVVKILLSKINH